MTYTVPSWLLFGVSILPLITGAYSLRLVPLAIIVTAIFLACWAYFITKTLSHKNSYDPKLKFVRFRQILLLAVLFIVLLCTYLSIPADGGGSTVAGVYVLGAFILLYWLNFVLKFIARSIATLEQQKPVAFDQYAGYFFGLLFFPIGIWWVNAKIRSLLRD